jgi:hypothetical protein
MSESLFTSVRHRQCYQNFSDRPQTDMVAVLRVYLPSYLLQMLVHSILLRRRYDGVHPRGSHPGGSSGHYVASLAVTMVESS